LRRDSPGLRNPELRMTQHSEEIRRQLAESAKVKQSFSDELIQRIAVFAERSAVALRDGGKLVFFGNGGSAADALHLAAELVVRLRTDRPGLAALALTANPSILTAAGNDYGFERIFARQIESMVNSRDVLVALSTSGTSPNILSGMDAAKSSKAYRVGFTGETGGALAAKVDLLLNVPSRDAQRIQEAHITIGHIACSLIETLMVRNAK
jgi:D-sedoheptulose 7-phosphate isomerase